MVSYHFETYREREKKADREGGLKGLPPNKQQNSVCAQTHTHRGHRGQLNYDNGQYVSLLAVVACVI